MHMRVVLYIGHMQVNVSVKQMYQIVLCKKM